MISARESMLEWGRYHRCLDGADFSLEANTEAAPEAGHFFLLRNGEVLLRTQDFDQIEVAYKALCREYWEAHLTSENLPARLSSAWGLLGMDDRHPAAMAVITTDGTPADCKRMESNSRRRRAQQKHDARLSLRRR